jgi:hypothetical protein
MRLIGGAVRWRQAEVALKRCITLLADKFSD